ncbi:MAG TPA: Spy/CpxP family protein refolding chaperone [Pyrinomonadaceae bacterium]|jgi:Spy/CpxP family protein refolding chaperone
MKNHVKLLIPVIVAILIGSLTFAFAQKRDEANKPFPKGERNMPPPPTGPNPRMLEELNLTDQQKEQVRALADKARTDSEQYFEELKTTDAQLRNLVESGNFSEEKARQILSTKAQVSTEMEIIRLRTDAAIFNLLTDEQKTQFAELKQKRTQVPPGGDFRPNKQ